MSVANRSKAKSRRNRKPSSLRSAAVLSDGEVGVFTSLAADATQLKTVKEFNSWLAETPEGDRGGLDIRGRVIAQLGIFKDRRGEFDHGSLQQLVTLGNKAKDKGIKSSYTHATMSNDGLGKLLGRDSGFYLDESGEIEKVRSKHFVLSSVAMKAPPEGGGTPYGEYIAELAISDPSAFSSSLVLGYKPEERYDDEGERQRDSDGRLKPAIWRPTRIHGIDCVDTGDAVDDFLSISELSDNDQFVRQASLMVEKFFDLDEISPEDLEARLNGFTKKVVALHFEDKMSKENENNPNAELLEAQKETNGLLKTMIENQTKLAAGDANPEKPGDQQPPADDAGKDKNKLAPADLSKKIAALCKAQGRPELAVDFLTADPPMTLDSVKDALLAKNSEGRQLDDNENDDQLGDEDKGKKGKGKTKFKNIDDQLKSEYAENAEFARLGLSFEDYAEDRKIELGEKQETAEIMDDKKSGLAKAGEAAVALLLILGASVLFLMSSDIASGVTFASMALVPLVGMAVTANQLSNVDGKVRRIRRRIAASKRIYDGTLTFNADGYLTDVIASGANAFAGVSFREYDNSNGTNGDVEGETTFEGLVTLVNVTHPFTVADIEKDIYASDNHTLTLTSASMSKVGVLKDIDKNGDPVIFIG